MNTKPTVISTFSGCGGSSLGYQMAGFKELLAIDFDDNSVKTFKLNFPDVPVWNRDIKKVTAKEILDFCGLKKGELDLLDGSPPCQGFSISGKRKVLDTRNELYKDFIRLIDGLRPKVFVMENVAGQIKGNMKGLFKEIMCDLKDLNYQVKAKLMNAKYYQVPQSRERIIYIGIRNDLNKKPLYPKASLNLISVREAFKNIENNDLKDTQIKNKNIKKYIKKMQSGETAAKYDKEKRYFNTCRTYWNKPSRTIIKTKNLLHPKEDRYLTINELKRLATFPDNFQFIGTYNQQWSRIGNAVMPNMMKAIALNIRKNIL